MVIRGIATRAKIERLIVSAGIDGISLTAARKKLNISRSAIALHCKALEMAGRIEKSSDCGWTTKWGAPGIREAYSAEKRARKTSPKRWQALKAAALWANVWTEQMPAHLCVSANDVPPLGKPGIASVWELAS